jgi:hypothetical protein
MQQQRRRSGMILGVLALGLLAGGVLTAGPAQAVDAAGPYYPLPSWDQKKAAVNRFVVLTNWSSQAVLDKETGLVWERTPSPTNNFLWGDARLHCIARTTGNRTGWRLPSIDELSSLIDPAHTTPALPTGHPFVIPQPIVLGHWTATTNATTASQAWYVDFNSGGVHNVGSKATGPGNAWCVRGGMNADVY